MKVYEMKFKNPVTGDVRFIRVNISKVKNAGGLRDYIDSRDFLCDYFLIGTRKVIIQPELELEL